MGTDFCPTSVCPPLTNATSRLPHRIHFPRPAFVQAGTEKVLATGVGPGERALAVLDVPVQAPLHVDHRDHVPTVELVRLGQHENGCCVQEAERHGGGLNAGGSVGIHKWRQ